MAVDNIILYLDRDFYSDVISSVDYLNNNGQEDIANEVTKLYQNRQKQWKKDVKEFNRLKNEIKKSGKDVFILKNRILKVYEVQSQGWKNHHYDLYKLIDDTLNSRELFED